MSRIAFLIALVACLIPAGTFAQPKLCLSDICIGDSIKDVHVNWSDAMEKGERSAPIRSERHQYIKRIFPDLSDSAIANLANYALLRVDNDSQRDFAEVRTVCRFITVTGNFKSESGYYTSVTFAPSFLADPQPGLFVVAIERGYPYGGDSYEGKQILEKLKEQFPQITEQSREKFQQQHPKPDKGVTYELGSTLVIELHHLLFPPRKETNPKFDEQLKRQGACRSSPSAD